MNAKRTTDRAMQGQLDRLASGDLAENDRRSLLAWLDEDASRWRACGLAFLEAQAWEAAMADRPEESDARVKTGPVGWGHSAKTPHGRTLWAQIAGLAACAALIFAAGHLTAQFGSTARPAVVERAPATAPPSTRPMLASLPIKTTLGPGVPAQLQIAVASVDGDVPRTPAVSDYVRKQWEKRGFEVKEERRYLPAKLPDGTPVLVPIDKVQVRLKGTPVS